MDRDLCSLFTTVTRWTVESPWIFREISADSGEILKRRTDSADTESECQECVCDIPSWQKWIWSWIQSQLQGPINCQSDTSDSCYSYHIFVIILSTMSYKNSCIFSHLNSWKFFHNEINKKTPVQKATTISSYYFYIHESRLIIIREATWVVFHQSNVHVYSSFQKLYKFRISFLWNFSRSEDYIKAKIWIKIDKSCGSQVVYRLTCGKVNLYRMWMRYQDTHILEVHRWWRYGSHCLTFHCMPLFVLQSRGVFTQSITWSVLKLKTYPNVCSCSGLAFDNWEMKVLGIMTISEDLSEKTPIRTYIDIDDSRTGAWGLISRKARHCSSSKTMSAGISFLMILPKIVSSFGFVGAGFPSSVMILV